MPNILRRVDIGAELMRVVEALTTVEGTRNWWSSETHGDASEGAPFSSAATAWRCSTPTQAS
jgi:hypothetical protein